MYSFAKYLKITSTIGIIGSIVGIIVGTILITALPTGSKYTDFIYIGSFLISLLISIWTNSISEDLKNDYERLNKMYSDYLESKHKPDNIDFNTVKDLYKERNIKITGYCPHCKQMLDVDGYCKNCQVYSK